MAWIEGHAQDSHRDGTDGRVPHGKSDRCVGTDDAATPRMVFRRGPRRKP